MGQSSVLELMPTDNHNDDTRTVRMGRRNDGTVEIEIASRHIGHLERWFRRRCALDLMQWKIYPNMKEISEAESLRHAMVKRMKMRAVRPDTVVVVVGDGASPRLGALLATTTQWQVFSIDPKLHGKDFSHIQRLWCIAKRIEQIRSPIAEQWPGGDAPGPVNAATRIVVAAPHSHAKLDEAVAVVRRTWPEPRVDVIAQPCCVRQTLDAHPHCDQRFEDLGCWSAKNVIQIWNDIGREEAHHDAPGAERS